LNLPTKRNRKPAPQQPTYDIDDDSVIKEYKQKEEEFLAGRKTAKEKHDKKLHDKLVAYHVTELEFFKEEMEVVDKTWGKDIDESKSIEIRNPKKRKKDQEDVMYVRTKHRYPGVRDKTLLEKTKRSRKPPQEDDEETEVEEDETEDVNAAVTDKIVVYITDEEYEYKHYSKPDMSNEEVKAKKRPFEEMPPYYQPFYITRIHRPENMYPQNDENE